MKFREIARAGSPCLPRCSIEGGYLLITKLSRATSCWHPKWKWSSMTLGVAYWILTSVAQRGGWVSPPHSPYVFSQRFSICAPRNLEVSGIPKSQQTVCLPPLQCKCLWTLQLYLFITYLILHLNGRVPIFLKVWKIPLKANKMISKFTLHFLFHLVFYSL